MTDTSGKCDYKHLYNEDYDICEIYEEDVY